eukprot:TRINITY_DN458_c0_g1_i2.p1 TRINITY_DN458_c0_g1~~TRINITY_DN458_c0_g1_i2.p1  ORF type:complete len:124 (+),score=35.25 TRINITY_DN458_c0_g1_i2:53-424(+)
MGRLRAKELRGKSREELLDELEQNKTELAQLRVQKQTGANASRLARLSELRRNIARILTVYNQERRANLTAQWAKNKYTPIDLRKKVTRKQRQRLSPKQAAAMTLRQKKKLAHFPQRTFAVKQ